MNYVCQLCNQAKATVHITDTMPDKRERHLCGECAEKEGVIIKQHHQTTSAILQEFIKHKAGIDRGDVGACRICGIIFMFFRLKGLVGGPHDYDAFRSLLAPLIERAHDGATHHVGKIPSTADSAVHKQSGLFKLRRDLEEALEREDYESAARLRDEIRGLEATEPA